MCPEPSHFDLSTLSDRGPIVVLSLIGVQEDDLTALPASRIEQLDIQGSKIADLHGIERLGNLRALGISGPTLPDLAPLAKVDVSELSLTVDENTDLSVLGRMRRLDELMLDVKDGSELPTLPLMSHLEWLTIDGKSVTKLDTVSKLVSLQALELSTPLVEDIGPLAGLVKLRRLSLAFTKVTNLKPLSGLSQLEALGIGNTRVTDLSPLFKLARLRTLRMLNTPVSKQSFIRFRRARPKCKVFGGPR